ncbi:MAG: fatty acid--CoA ligase family protein [Pseudomonadota bacterium]
MSLTYAELPERIERAYTSLGEQGLARRDYVALESDNTLDALLLLLATLNGGHHVALLPSAGDAPTPAFCRYRLRSDAVLVPNAQWNGANAIDSRGALLARTSGTTGQAKLACHSLERLKINATNCRQRFMLSKTDRVFIPVALAHMFGLGAGVLPALLAGASIELLAQANVLTYFAREARFAPTVTYLTPAFCQALARARKAPRAYRLTVTAGDRIDRESFDAYEALHGPLVSLYGSTELGAIAAGCVDDPSLERRASSGRPMAGVTVTLRSADGEAGELLIEHPSGFLGYADSCGRPIGQDAVHRSADLGRVLADGSVRVLGRLDHQAKRDGKLVALGDVEAALEQLPQFRRAVAFADHRAPPGPRGSYLVACCEAADGTAWDEKALRRASMDVLPKHAIPDRFHPVIEWPQLPSGKIDRQALIKKYT